MRSHNIVFNIRKSFKIRREKTFEDGTSFLFTLKPKTRNGTFCWKLLSNFHLISRQNWDRAEMKTKPKYSKQGWEKGEWGGLGLGSFGGFSQLRREGFHGHKTVGERWVGRLTGQRRTDPFVFRVYIFRPTSFLTATTGLGRSMTKSWCLGWLWEFFWWVVGVSGRIWLVSGF